MTSGQHFTIFPIHDKWVASASSCYVSERIELVKGPWQSSPRGGSHAAVGTLFHKSDKPRRIFSLSKQQHYTQCYRLMDIVVRGQSMHFIRSFLVIII